MDKYIGRLLDNRYEILEVIGTGGMAVVYKARCHRLNRLVAIKILKDDFMEDEEFRRRFHSESQAVAMLSHPNIVSVYDVSTSITADYIVMELIDGITLKQYMEKKGVLNWKETLHFAIQIAKALEHAHSRGIVHRDIKPHNVMVLKNGSVKVTDFGIARMMSKGNTLTKEALGSVHYISPEQAKGGRVDNRSDIYSLGVVMYEMMSGRPPYDGESPVSVAIQHINGGAVMPSTLNPNIPGGLEQIIMKAMAHEPDNRYATATAMLADLDEFRKNPAILFDYNAAAAEDVIVIPKGPLVLDLNGPKTTAEKKADQVERKTQPGQRRPPERRQAGGAASAEAAQRRRQQEARRRREAEADQRRNKVATIAIIACSVAMLVAVIILLIVSFTSKPEDNTIEVPNLLNMVYENVKDSDKYKDFTIKMTSEHNDDYDAGVIFKQEPAAGEKVTKGKTIWIVVSLGPQNGPVLMPDLANHTLEEAKEKIDALGLDLNVEPPILDYDDKIPANTVIKTEPEPGTELKKGDIVKIYASKGKEIKKNPMPDLVGTEDKPVTQAEAETQLDDMKMELIKEFPEEFSSTIKKGNVIRTEPAAGEELQTGQKVLVYISKGPEMREIPDVLDKNVDKAYDELIKAGFTTVVKYGIEDSGEALNTVFEIRLGDEKGKKLYPGNDEDINATIVLFYAKEKELVTKDVVLTLPENAATGTYTVVVTRKDTMKTQTLNLPHNAQEIKLPGETGLGEVVYSVDINSGAFKKDYTVTFE